MQYFTGSKAHNIALRDRAIGRGLKLNEYGLFRVADDCRVAGEREEDIYAGLGLDFVPPELREMRGEIDAAEAHALPRLIERADLRGDLHMHTTETDGKDDIRTMALAAREAGLEYIAITDHSQSLAMANGLDERRAIAHAARIRAVDAEGLGIRVLAGVECDIKPDGSLDLADDCLAALDLVVASVHSAFNQERQEMTDRVLRALENPHVDILGHGTGRMLLKRQAYPIDIEAVVDAAQRAGAAIEINSQPHRLDFNDVHARLARDRGVPIVISSDSHSRHGFGYLRWGAATARRAWLQAGRRAQHPTVRRLPCVLETAPENAFMKLPMLSADDKHAEIRRLYFKTTKATIQQDLEKALDLLKSMASEEERERATVYMEGLAQMRKDWSGRQRAGKGSGQRASGSRKKR